MHSRIMARFGHVYKSALIVVALTLFFVVPCIEGGKLKSMVYYQEIQASKDKYHHTNSGKSLAFDHSFAVHKADLRFTTQGNHSPGIGHSFGGTKDEDFERYKEDMKSTSPGGNSPGIGHSLSGIDNQNTPGMARAGHSTTVAKHN